MGNYELFAKGIGAVQQAADTQQMADSWSVILNVMIVAGLQQSCTDALNAAKNNVFLTTVGIDPVTGDQIPGNQQGSYEEAYQEAYQSQAATNDSQISNSENGLETLKQQTQTDGSLVTNALSLADPVEQLLQLSVHAITGWGGASKG